MHVSTRNKPMLISSLINETDRSFIESALNSGDSYILSGLSLNKNLTPHDYVRLFENGKTHTRETLTQNPMISIGLLLKLSEDPEDSVRVAALKNERIPLDTLKYKVLVEKMKSTQLKEIAKNFLIVSDFELFKHFWSRAKPSRVKFIHSIEEGLTGYRGSNQIDANLFSLDVSVAEFIHSQVLDQTNAFRQAYANCKNYADSDILHLLKDDKYKPVLTTLAKNPKTLLKTQKYLLENNPKSAEIKLNLAGIALDYNFLQEIYESTENAAIHRALILNRSFKKSR